MVVVVAAVVAFALVTVVVVVEMTLLVVVSCQIVVASPWVVHSYLPSFAVVVVDSSGTFVKVVVVVAFVPASDQAFVVAWRSWMQLLTLAWNLEAWTLQQEWVVAVTCLASCSGLWWPVWEHSSG